MATVKEINAQRASRVASGLDPYTGTAAGGAEAVSAAAARSGGASGVTQQGMTAPIGVTLSSPTSQTNPQLPATPTPVAPTNPLTPASTPTTPNTAPNQAQVNAPSSNTQATPEQVQAVAEATRQVNDLASQYKTGLANVQAQGLPPSNTQGQAMGTVQANLPNSQQEAPSIVGSIMETDSNFDSILTMYDDFMSPQTQRTSLLEEYQQISKTLGIEQMNAELINSKRIIEGTEDDIRSEITAVGGFGTESQVLAMANARNKSLIKNYNYLLESRDSAMTQLNTMMNLSIQDRQMAEAEFDRKMNFAFKVQEFQERATNNARQTYMSLGEKMGWDTLLSSVSPYEQSVIQKTLGVSGIALQNLAVQSQKDRLVLEDERTTDMAIKKQQLTNLKLEGQKKAQELSPQSTGDAQSWATNIRNGDAKLSDVPSELKNGVSTLLAIGDKNMSASALGSVELANSLINDPNLKYTTGISGAMPKFLFAGSNAATTKGQLDQLKNQLALNNRSQLKGTGTISDFESKMLNAASSAISGNLNTDAMKQELKKVRGIIQVMNNQPINVKLIDPTTGEEGYVNLNSSGLETAINDGLLIEYQ